MTTANEKQKTVRRTFFLLLFVLTTTIYFIIDIFDIYDSCLTVYWMELIASLSCGVLYSWWWYSSGSASDVFRWLTVLFFAQAIRLIGNIIVRTNFLYGINKLGIAGPPPEYLDILWIFRNFPEFMALLFMLSLILSRIWCNVPSHRCLHED